MREDVRGQIDVNSHMLSIFLNVDAEKKEEVGWIEG
jgi:hypothetical protein